jgi:hypothetical protein
MEMDLRKTVPNLPDPSKLVFGHMFTDHMLSINWNAKTGCKFESFKFLWGLSVELAPGQSVDPGKRPALTPGLKKGS